MSYPNEIYSVVAFLGFLACIIPLPWHLEAWNTGTCLYMIWTAIGCLNQFINSIVWKGNVINWAPVWCDISSRIIVGLTMAIPASCLCITRRLYAIASVENTPITASSRRRHIILVDLAIGVGLPILHMILYYIPQGHRFDIIEDVGCFPTLHRTWVALVLVALPPVIVGLVSMVYSVLSIIAFNKSLAHLDAMPSSKNNLTSNRYARMMSFAGIELMANVPIATWTAVINFKDGFAEPFSWASTHYGFSRVVEVPAIYWRNGPAAIEIEFTRWTIIVCAVVFFGFFGFSDEAKKHYREYASLLGYSLGIISHPPPNECTSTISNSNTTTIERAHPFPIYVDPRLFSPDVPSPITPSDGGSPSSSSAPSIANSKHSFTVVGTHNIV